jgi:hypothetical protein
MVADSVRALAAPDTIPLLVPAADQARGVDAELRVALLELSDGQPLQALSRLDWLASQPTVVSDAGAEGALLARQAMLFLLSQAQFRLGMSDSFRATAEPLLGAPDASRYASLLRLQLALDAYRRGELARVASFAGGAGSPDERALGALVAGLAQYAGRDFAAAQASFDAAAGSRGPFSGYARYMSALSAMTGDTARAQQALDAMRSLSGQALGEFGDQVNLTTAQLAYQRGQYDVAAQLAANVAVDGGLGAQALLTRGWALYRAGQLAEAEAAFRDFATRFPQLPQRDEARLMVGQVMLETGRVDDAGRHFQAIADSVTSEATAMQGSASASMADAARALVQARATELLFLNEPAAGKTLAVPAQDARLAALVTGRGDAASDTLPGDPVRPEIVSLADVRARLDSMAPPLGAGFPQRLVYLSETTDAQRTAYAQRADALRRADAAVALARWRLQQQLDAYTAKIAVTQNLQQMLASENEAMAEVGRRLAATRDSLTRLASSIAETQSRLLGIMSAEAEMTRQLAAENRARLDSIRANLSGAMSPEDQGLLDTELRTAQTYESMARMVADGLGAAFQRHPVNRMRDSVAARLARNEGLVSETQGLIAQSNQILTDELARLQGSEPERVRAGRATLAQAEAQRTGAEAALVAAVDAELRARSTRLLALLRRDVEAAEFGAASAAFFKAAAADGAAPASGTSAPPGGTASGVRDEAREASPSTQPIPPR